MAFATRALIWGRRKTTVANAIQFIAAVSGLFALIVITYLAGVLLGEPGPDGRTLDPFFNDLFGALIFFGPAFVSALSAYHRGGLVTSLALAPIPSAATVATIPIARRYGAYINDELGYYLITYALAGFVGALVGFGVGTVARWTVGKIRGYDTGLASR